MYTGTVGKVFGTLFIFLIEIVCCAELSEYTELEPYRNTVGNVNIIEKFDLTKYQTTCWRLCQRNTQCTSYFENNVSGKCYIALSELSEEQVEEEYGWKYFVKASRQIQTGKRCPTELGYTYDGGTKLCIKLLSQSKMYRYQALINCTNDGGRLLQITNEKQQEVLANYMQTYHPSINNPLIDGRRSNGNGVSWTFENGEVLTYFKWFDNEPAINKNCIRVLKNDNFEWASVYCQVKNLFLCEIPI